jgi:hypothetical protein
MVTGRSDIRIPSGTIFQSVPNRPDRHFALLIVLITGYNVFHVEG